MIDARVTPDLKREGMARDVIRQVQNLRKEANLEMEDRIVLHLHTESAELRQAVETHRAYIASETLTVQWSTTPLGEGAAKGECEDRGPRVDDSACGKQRWEVRLARGDH